MCPVSGLITREQVVLEARSWVKTPYHPAAMVKGAGCDCGTLLLGVFSNIGLLSPSLLDEYKENSPMFWAHSAENRYLLRVMKHAKKILESVAYRSTTIEPGNIVLTKPRTSPNNFHGGIVTSWPLLVHSVLPCVEEVDATKDALWACRPIEVFDPFQSEESPT